MVEFENRNETQLAEDKLWEIDYLSDDEVPGKEYIKSLNMVTTFYDYVYLYAQKNGFAGEKSDADTLAKFVFKLSKKRSTPLSSSNTVNNWLKGSPPAHSSVGRENVYTLCFVLGLNEVETKEFFLKAYLERPFNYKNIHEAVYFYCLKNCLSYSDAQRIIERIEAIPFKGINADAEVITEQIGQDISSMNNEDDLVKYLVENRANFAIQNQTAAKKVSELLVVCKEIMLKLRDDAEKEEGTCKCKVCKKEFDYIEGNQFDDCCSEECWEQRKKTCQLKMKKCLLCGKEFGYYTNSYSYGNYCSWNCYCHRYESDAFLNEINNLSTDDLLENILGFRTREEKRGKKTYNKSISKSELPKLIKSNFPDMEQDFKWLKKGGGSFDSIRKELILLHFYAFWGEVLYKGDFDEVLFGDYTYDVDQLLDECGYVQLYWRNPYDWLFGYCSRLDRPLEQLKSVIKEFYLNHLED